MLKQPICVALEGVDCAGKGTMAKKVVAALKHTEALRGVPIHLVSFPQYELLSGQMIKKYLNGDYKGDSKLDVDFYASLYTTNRQEYFHLNQIDVNAIYVFDRYVYSNVTHQMAKLWKKTWKEFEVFIDDDKYPIPPEGKESFIDRLTLAELDNLFGIWSLNEPRFPFKTFYLNIDIDTVMYRLNHRKIGKHVGKDIHETRSHLTMAIEFVNWMKKISDSGKEYKNIIPKKDELEFIDVKHESGEKIIYDYIMKEFEGRK